MAKSSFAESKSPSVYRELNGADLGQLLTMHFCHCWETRRQPSCCLYGPHHSDYWWRLLLCLWVMSRKGWDRQASSSVHGKFAVLGGTAVVPKALSSSCHWNWALESLPSLENFRKEVTIPFFFVLHVTLKLRNWCNLWGILSWSSELGLNKGGSGKMDLL